MLHPHPVIERNSGCQRPVILRIHSEFEVRAFVWNLIREIDSLEQLALGAEDIHRVKREESPIVRHSQRSTDFPLMRSQHAPRGRRPDLEPLSSPGVAALYAEVISPVALRSHNHAAIALCADKSVEPLHRRRAVKRTAEEPEMVRERRYVVALRVAGCDRLGIEILGTYKIDVLRAEMIGEVDNLPWRSEEHTSELQS